MSCKPQPWRCITVDSSNLLNSFVLHCRKISKTNMSLTPAKPKPNSIHHQKRQGTHQKQTKRFKDTYWPYLPMLLIVGIGLLASSLWSGAARGVLGATTDITASNLLADTNTQRTASHEHALQLNSQLTQAAQTKATDMASRNYWSHATPDGKQPWAFVQQAGYAYKSAGENLAYGFSSADATVQGWMNSAEHRANILDQSYQEVGFGTATAPDYQGHGQQTIVVAMYGEPSAYVSLASADSPGGATRNFAIANQSTQQIARVQLLTLQPWTMLIVIAIAAFAAGIFVIRHAVFWHRALVRSEAFVIKHRTLDFIFVGIAVLGIILTRTAGFIH